MDVEDLESSDLKKQEELEDITTCCICTEVYTDPKALPCIHTFCMNCLHETGLNTNKGAGDEMPCPICRRLFKIPEEGFPGLPHHFFMERLIQVSNVSKPHSASAASCSRCQHEIEEDAGKEIPPADAHCVDCKKNLCSECCSEHRKSKVTKNHELRGLPISEYESGQNVTADLAPVICEVHEQKVMGVFCADCKAIVCAKCFNEKHSNHNCSDINNSADDFRKQIEDYTEAVNKCIADAKVKKSEIMQVKEEMQRKVEELQSDVEKKKFEIKEIADKHASRLVQSLCSSMQSKLKEIHLATDDIDAYILNLENYNSYCQRLMDKGSAHDICRASLDLSSKAIELQKQVQPMIETEIHNLKLRFRQSELKVRLEEDCHNLIGEIVDEDDLKPRNGNKQSLLSEHRADTDNLRQEGEEEANHDAGLEKLKQELENNDAAIVALQESNDKLRLELDAEKTTNNSLKTNGLDRANLEAQLDELKQEIMKNKTEMNDLHDSNNKLIQELGAEKIMTNSLQTNKGRDKANFEARLDELNQEIKKQDQEMEKNKILINELQFSNDNLKQTLDTATTANSSLQVNFDNANATYKAHRNELNQELDNKKIAIDDLHASNEELQQKLHIEKQKNKSLQTSNKNLDEDLNKYKAIMQTLETNTEKLQKEQGHITNDETKRRVRKAYSRFISDVDPDVLGDYLKQEDVISIDCWETIIAQKSTSKDKCRAVLDFLLKKEHQSAFLVVRQALEKDGHYQHILDIIDKEDNRELNSMARTNLHKSMHRSSSATSGLSTGRPSREAQCEDPSFTNFTSLPYLQPQFRDKQSLMLSNPKSEDVCAARISEVEPRHRAANEDHPYNQAHFLQERIGMQSLIEREEQLRIDRAAFEEMRKRSLEESSTEMPQKGTPNIYEILY